MRLIITENVGRWAANYTREKIRLCAPTAERNFVLGLPTGGTAVEMYNNFIEMYRQQTLSFKNITTFNMDEYIGLPREHRESYHTYMHEKLFNHVDMDLSKVNIPDGNASDIPAECRSYEQKIKDAGGIDLFIGGVGENGHIAFNEPYSSLLSVTRDKQLDMNTLVANSRFFDNDVTQVPKSAITVGIKTLLEADEVLIMVKGDKKAFALRQCMEGAVSHEWPVTALQMHPKAIIVADDAACIELKVKTYKYFKELNDEYSYIEGL